MAHATRSSPTHWYLQPPDSVRLAEAISLPLVHGEREWPRLTIRDCLVSGAARLVPCEATRPASFTAAIRIATLAAQHGVVIAPHTAPPLHGHRVSACGASACAAASHGDHARHPIHHGLYVYSPAMHDGMLRFNARPGFGVESDWTFVKQHQASSAPVVRRRGCKARPQNPRSANRWATAVVCPPTSQAFHRYFLHSA